MLGLDVEVEAKKLFEKLLNDIEELGYSLRFSHGGNDLDDWYDLVVSIEDVDERKILESIDLWNTFNQLMINTYIRKGSVYA